MKYNKDKTLQIDDKKRPFYVPIVRMEEKSKYELKYDSLGREIEKLHYSNEKFLSRTVAVYERHLKTKYIYDDSPDKLGSFTEEKYTYLASQPVRPTFARHPFGCKSGFHCKEEGIDILRVGLVRHLSSHFIFNGS
ncbi:MAG: hypothetical protein IPN76_05280 [Saprospiraceae bacterium]|nr:hypothetical protein [Saprospiraceae bacterium]